MSLRDFEALLNILKSIRAKEEANMETLKGVTEQMKLARDIVESHQDVTRWSNAKLRLYQIKIADELERRRQEILTIKVSTHNGLKTSDPEAIRVWEEQEKEYRRLMREEYGNN